MEGRGGGGGSGLAQIIWSTFLLRGIFLFFTGVLFVICLQFIVFTLKKNKTNKSIDIWDINAHWGKSSPQVLTFHVPLIWAMPGFGLFFFFMCVLPNNN